MREYALQRTLPYWVEPSQVWKANRGVLYHEVLAKYAPAGWLAEQEVGPVELWPGIAVSGRIDAAKADWSEIWDFKSQDAPVPRWDKTLGATGGWSYEKCKDYGLSDHWVLQLNLYRLIVRREHSPRMIIWRVYDGVKDAKLAWKPFEVPRLSDADLYAKVVEGPNGWREFLKVMRIRPDPDGGLAQRIEAIKHMPLAGRTQFGGRKCFEYCGQKLACDGLIPAIERY